STPNLVNYWLNGFWAPLDFAFFHVVHDSPMISAERLDCASILLPASAPLPQCSPIHSVRSRVMTLLCSMDTRRHLHLALAKTPPYLDSDWKWLKENYCANYSRPNQTARKLDL